MGSITQQYTVYDVSAMVFEAVGGGAEGLRSERLRGGFALRFRLASLPESGLTLLELPGALRLFTHEVTAAADSGWNRSENLRMRLESDGRCRGLALEMRVARHDFPDYPPRGGLRAGAWERVCLSVPYWLLEGREGVELSVLYDGVSLRWLVDGEEVNADYPVGELREQEGPCVVATPEVFERLEVSVDLGRLRREVRQETREGQVQFFTPRGFNTWIGDVVLYWHDGVFHALYLLDRHHHGSRWGGGAHRFCQLTSRDLVHWTDHGPLFELERPWQSVGTGTMVYHGGRYLFVYGWHTSRTIPPERTATPLMRELARAHGGRMAALDESQLEGRYPSGSAYAVSEDGIRFTMAHKVIHTAENPSVYANGRGGLSMYCGGSTWEADGIDGPWTCVSDHFPPCGRQEPMLNTDECPSFFDWRGDSYLLMGGSGFWHRPAGSSEFRNAAAEGRDIYDGLNVPMAAPFAGDRMLLAGWIRGIGWASCLVFRELLHYPDGHLGMRWVPELEPARLASLPGCPSEVIVSPSSPVPLPAPASGDDALYEMTVAAPSVGRLGVRLHDCHHPALDCEFQLDFGRQRMQVATLGGQTGLCRTLLTLRESLKVQPSERLGMDIQTVDGYHAGSRDFALERVDVLDGQPRLRLWLHADAKMRSTVLDIEVAGQRTLVSHRVGMTVTGVELVADVPLAVAGLTAWRVR
ncbi:MAG: hypothetical protein ACI4WT_07890 [Oligosphaeraceae bacterium]